MQPKQGAVLILAGGRSRRMGTDKARLPIAGTTLLDWQGERLAALGLPVWHCGADGIMDDWSDYRGPLAGLYSALKHHPETNYWLVVPVDMPALPLERMHQLAVSVTEKSVPVAFQHSPFPLAVPASTQLMNTLENWLNQVDGPRSIRAFMEKFNGDWLEESLDDNEQLNINTPEDWQSFLQTLK